MGAESTTSPRSSQQPQSAETTPYRLSSWMDGTSPAKTELEWWARLEPYPNAAFSAAAASEIAGKTTGATFDIE